jgi:hypothetical protein
MTTLLQRGDLVRGKKPWNRETMLGVVVEQNSVHEAPTSADTFRVFWLNDSANNNLSSKNTFSTWEVSDSLERIADVE